MREDGFFQGAMYVSYGLGILEFAILAWGAHRIFTPTLGLGGAMLIAAGAHLLLVPILWRYSRVIWSHINVGTRTPQDADG